MSGRKVEDKDYEGEEEVRERKLKTSERRRRK